MKRRWIVAGLLMLASLPPTAGMAAKHQSIPNPIPLESNPITDAKRIAQMRRAGQLPDTFTKGRCRYDLAGDPGAAYYVKTCR